MDFHGFTKTEIQAMAENVRNRAGDYLTDLETLEGIALSTLAED